MRSMLLRNTQARTTNKDQSRTNNQKIIHLIQEVTFKSLVVPNKTDLETDHSMNMIKMYLSNQTNQTG